MAEALACHLRTVTAERRFARKMDIRCANCSACAQIFCASGPAVLSTRAPFQRVLRVCVYFDALLRVCVYFSVLLCVCACFDVRLSYYVRAGRVCLITCVVGEVLKISTSDPPGDRRVVFVARAKAPPCGRSFVGMAAHQAGQRFGDNEYSN